MVFLFIPKKITTLSTIKKVRLDWLIDKHFGSKNLQNVEIVLLSKHARKYNLKKMAIMGWSSSFEFIVGISSQFASMWCLQEI
jgi:hypothetical protein